MSIDTRADLVCGDTSVLSRSEWLALRKTGIGSSDAAAALGLSPWVSQFSLWAEKRGLLADEDGEKERFRVGRDAEPLVIGWWAEREGIDLSTFQRHVMLRSAEHPFMLANPDALSEDTVVEAKTAHPMDEKRWDAGIPDQYVIQGLHLMAVTRRQRCIFPVCFGWAFPRTFEVTWDQATADAMVTVEAEMWRRIEENEAPDVDGSEATMMALREMYYAVDFGKVVALPERAMNLIDERFAAVETAKVHTDAAARVKAQLVQMLGDAEAGEYGGQIVVTFKADKNGTRRMYFPGRD